MLQLFYTVLGISVVHGLVPLKPDAMPNYGAAYLPLLRAQGPIWMNEHLRVAFNALVEFLVCSWSVVYGDLM